ncbi:MAG: rane protein [Herbaspirillum sp.]|nr:rane protein [Herbaspirillum sp.]
MINRTQDSYGASPGDEASASGVSWGAILAGAFAAAALSFILIILGFGLGFSAISPWTGSGADAQTIGVATILWVAFTQIAASAIGGYMAGRLRVRWAGVHNDEVYFRDTAHGFLAWAVASLATAILLTSAIGGVISGGGKAAGTAAVMAGATGIRASMAGPNGMNDASGASGYFIDALFRPAPNPGVAAATTPADASPAAIANPTGNTTINPGNVAPDPAQRAEVTRIFANALRRGGLSDPDKTYVAQVLAKRNGMSQADAEKRVNDTYTAYSKRIADAENNAKAAAEKARKAAAYSALWMFVALLCGAFVASLCATFGGRMRDRVILVNSVSGVP